MSAGKPLSSAHWHAVEMLLLQQVMKHTGKSGRTDAALKTLLQLMSELFGLNLGRVLTADAGGQALSVRCAYGLTRAQIERAHYRRGEGICGTVWQNGAALLVRDVRENQKFLGRAVLREELPVGHTVFLALPIVADGVCVGVLACHRVEAGERPLRDDVALLRTLADVCGRLLDCAAEAADKTVAPERVAEDYVRPYLQAESHSQAQLAAALAECKGNKTRAAQLLGLTPRQFHYRWNKLAED